MNAPDARRGGLEVWAPSVGPPIGVDLSDEQALAIAFRHLAGIGFAENMAGHITWQLNGRSDMFVNPWGLWWQEITASDICVVDVDARVGSSRTNGWGQRASVRAILCQDQPYFRCPSRQLGGAADGPGARAYKAVRGFGRIVGWGPNQGQQSGMPPRNGRAFPIDGVAADPQHRSIAVWAESQSRRPPAGQWWPGRGRCGPGPTGNHRDRR